MRFPLPRLYYRNDCMWEQIFESSNCVTLRNAGHTHTGFFMGGGGSFTTIITKLCAL